MAELKIKSVLLLCGIIFGALVGTKSWKKREIVPETPADEENQIIPS